MPFFPSPIFPSSESDMTSGLIDSGLSCDCLLGSLVLSAPVWSVSPNGVSGESGVSCVYLLLLRGVFCMVFGSLE